MNTNSERYRWARQPALRAHLRDLEKLRRWEAMVASNSQEARLPDVIARDTPPLRPLAPPARTPARYEPDRAEMEYENQWRRDVGLPEWTFREWQAWHGEAGE